jgi:hypothetical protein
MGPKQKTSVGRIVHYVSYGSPVQPDGTQAFRSVCRAAIITECEDPYKQSPDQVVGLAVFQPNGCYFNDMDGEGSKHEEPSEGKLMLAGGTWHWPERV